MLVSGIFTTYQALVSSILTAVVIWSATSGYNYIIKSLSKVTLISNGLTNLDLQGMMQVEIPGRRKFHCTLTSLQNRGRKYCSRCCNFQTSMYHVDHLNLPNDVFAHIYKFCLNYADTREYSGAKLLLKYFAWPGVVLYQHS